MGMLSWTESCGGLQEFSCVTIDTESVFTSRLHELFSSQAQT